MDPDGGIEGLSSPEDADGGSRRRAECAEWFSLADDASSLFARVVRTASRSEAAHGSNWSPPTVAVRLLMRTTGSFAAAVLLAERGLAVPSRTLVRSIIEDSFVAAALTTKLDDIVKMLRDGAEASRRAQGEFILARKLGRSDLDRDRLREAIDRIDRGLGFVRPRKVAEMSSMLPQYLNYMLLSEDSAHPSATSLHKHVRPSADGKGWDYRMEPDEGDEIRATLHRAILAAMPVAIVVNQLVPDPVNGPALTALAERWRSMPDYSIL